MLISPTVNDLTWGDSWYLHNTVNIRRGKCKKHYRLAEIIAMKMSEPHNKPEFCLFYGASK
jgi:hypothetical protein